MVGSTLELKAQELGDVEFTWQRLEGDFHYPKIFNMNIVYGRLFDERNVADSNAVLINESALKDLAVSKENATGLTLENPHSHEKYRVIGVIRDFPYTTIRKKILPLMVTAQARDIESVFVKVQPQDPSSTVNFLETQWKKHFPLVPFEYWFIDDEFARMYRTEMQTGVMIKYFAILAIIVACLGLSGLAAFTAEQKTKEIGIRKILGATTWQVLSMLSLRFSKLIGIAMLLSLPITYIACNTWLETFTYKIEISALFFAAAIATIFFITLLTVGLESMKAARANPAETIRTE